MNDSTKNKSLVLFPSIPKRRKHQGFSLLETIIAFAVLISAFTVFFRLYHAALGYSGRTDQQIVAVNVAQRQIVKLRAWAATDTGSSYNFDDWSSFTDVTFPDEEHPEYEVRIQSEFIDAFSPGSALSVTIDKKTLRRTHRKVQISVTWPRGSFETVTLLADPTRRLRSNDPVIIDGDSATTIARDGTLNLSFKVFDTNGTEIPDVMGEWFVQPISGTGSITSNLDGSAAIFTHATEQSDGTTQYASGDCRVRVRIVYRGVEAWGESEVLVLAP